MRYTIDHKLQPTDESEMTRMERHQLEVERDRARVEKQAAEESARMMIQTAEERVREIEGERDRERVELQQALERAEELQQRLEEVEGRELVVQDQTIKAEHIQTGLEKSLSPFESSGVMTEMERWKLEMERDRVRVDKQAVEESARMMIQTAEVRVWGIEGERERERVKLQQAPQRAEEMQQRLEEIEGRELVVQDQTIKAEHVQTVLYDTEKSLSPFESSSVMTRMQRWRLEIERDRARMEKQAAEKRAQDMEGERDRLIMEKQAAEERVAVERDRAWVAKQTAKIEMDRTTTVKQIAENERDWVMLMKKAAEIERDWARDEKNAAEERARKMTSERERASFELQQALARAFELQQRLEKVEGRELVVKEQTVKAEESPTLSAKSLSPFESTGVSTGIERRQLAITAELRGPPELIDTAENATLIEAHHPGAVLNAYNMQCTCTCKLA